MPLASDYDYELPKRLIAQHPTPRRTDARLLLVDRASQSLQHHHIRDLPTLLRAGDCLVLNDTRVIPARLVGYRVETRGRWEGLFLSADQQGNWLLLGKTRGKLKPGDEIMLLNQRLQEVFPVRLVIKEPDGAWVARPLAKGEPLALLEQVGRVPLPPYIRSGEMAETDTDRYQTVFASAPGSVAAPTAGLHFTHDLLRRLSEAGVRQTKVTLHVGPDTFRPLTSDSLDEHVMHSEWGELNADAAAALQSTRASAGRVVAVGTTSVRVLETAARNGTMTDMSGPTDLFIRPPYKFRAVDALLTNFHLPRTTLLVLVRTFGGDELIQRAYEEAVREEYRFYSYGDAMLIV